MMAKTTRAQTGSAGAARNVAPYGSWKSPITSDLIVEKSVDLSEVRLDGDDIYWLEERPEEEGRNVVVRAGGPPDGMNPSPFNARDEVHSYGGGAWIVDNGSLYFSNFSDGRLYRQDRHTKVPHPITPTPASSDRPWRFADGLIDRGRNRWIGVREDHTDPTQTYPVNTIVAVDLDGSGSSAGTILALGHDFYSSPRLSPDGGRLAWLAWDQPDMPWTRTTLYVAALNGTGAPAGEPAVIAGGGEISLFQPEWSPDGSALFYVSDESGWWNLYCYDFSRKSSYCIQPMEAEFGRAQGTSACPLTPSLAPTR
jgi:WD40-like Beta Propeller Repeat